MNHMRDTSGHTVKRQVLEALRHLLAPIVRVLLRNGVTWNEFEQIGKELFVEVARSDYGVHGRPTNTARVALLTGLSRREVTRVKAVLVGEKQRAAPAPTRISEILAGWHLDTDFRDADGTPRVLPVEGERSITTLFKRYAGDMPHGAVLGELEELRLVEHVAGGFRVTARDYIRGTDDPDLIRQGGIALHDHAATVAHNVDAARSAPARFERMATTQSLPRRHVRAFAAFLAAEGQAFLERVDTWLTEHASTANALSPSERRVRAGVGVYAIQEQEPGASQS
jgi:hypothetical protein